MYFFNLQAFDSLRTHFFILDFISTSFSSCHYFCSFNQYIIEQFFLSPSVCFSIFIFSLAFFICFCLFILIFFPQVRQFLQTILHKLFYVEQTNDQQAEGLYSQIFLHNHRKAANSGIVHYISRHAADRNQLRYESYDELQYSILLTYQFYALFKQKQVHARHLSDKQLGLFQKDKHESSSEAVFIQANLNFQIQAKVMTKIWWMNQILNIYKCLHIASFSQSIQLYIFQVNCRKTEYCITEIAHIRQKSQYHPHFLNNIHCFTISQLIYSITKRTLNETRILGQNKKILIIFQFIFFPFRKIILQSKYNQYLPLNRNYQKQKDNKRQNISFNIYRLLISYQTNYINQRIFQVTTMKKQLTVSTLCEQKIQPKNSQLLGYSVTKITWSNFSVQNRPKSNNRVKPQQLEAIKERIKGRNKNKQNNPLYQSENIWGVNTQKENLCQPIQDINKIHLPCELNDKLNINDFQIGDLLGRGAQARVRIAFHKPTGSVYSIKTLQRRKIQQKMDLFIRSLKIQMFLDHPNIAKIYGIIVEQKEVHLVMEYCADGDITMNRYIFGKQNKITKSVLQKISDAVHVLHSNRIQHRDLKLQNVLLSYGVPKITDFQLSVYTRLDFFPRKTICGTPAYFSPEMIQKHRYNKKADIWCLGIIFYQLLCGYFPFQIRNMQDIHNISSKEPKQLPRTLSTPAVDLINKMLTKQSQNRISIQSVLMHQFFTASKKQEKEIKK